MQRLPLEFDLPDALWAYILAAPDRSTAPSPPSSFALDHAPSIRSILRASGTCRSSRRALQFIERAAVESAAEGNARALSLFPAAKRIDVRFVAAHSAQEQAEAALEAGIGEGAQGGEANQQAATEASRQHADMRGDAEELAQRLPFALCVIPNLSNVHTDYAGCQDVTPQARAVFKTFLLGVCNARSAGQLRSLLYLEHGYLSCRSSTCGHASCDGNFCARLLRDAPVDNLIDYFDNHGLCTSKVEVAEAMVRRGVPLNQPLPQFNLSMHPWIYLGVLDSRWPPRTTVFSGVVHQPTYFDTCFASCMSASVYEVGRDMAAIGLLLDGGGRPGAALQEAAASGALATLIKESTATPAAASAQRQEASIDVDALRARLAEAVVAWVRGWGATRSRS